MSAMALSSVDFQQTSGAGGGCGLRLRRRRGRAISGRMKLIVSALAALLLASSPLAAQTLEADMKKAAGAYEQKDMATAVRIWKVWAGKGNAEARTLLGAMYWSGEGVPRDHKEAARLYTLAANQGYARAQNDIGFMLGFGEGVPPADNVEAYKWLTLAIKGYTEKNQDRLDQARKDLATLAKRMSPAQISEAERRAKAFKPTP
jgi:TPR repeat protein